MKEAGGCREPYAKHPLDLPTALKNLSMRPIFTIHAGEFLVGQYIESAFKDKHVWVPTKDVGVDLLVTNAANTEAVPLQVKLSRDFLPVMKLEAAVLRKLKSRTWFRIERKGLVKSTARYWIFVLLGFENHSCDYLVVNPQLLARTLTTIHGELPLYHVYVCVTEKGKAWLTRDLKTAAYEAIANGAFDDANRDVSRHLNNWAAISSPFTSSKSKAHKTARPLRP
jgi:hypothetical protein